MPGSSPKNKSASGSPEPATDAPTAIASTPPLEADELEPEDVLGDGDSGIGSTHSSTTSVRDEMIQQRREHGRQYQGYMGANYVLPMDEQEYERLDFQCHLIWLTLGKQHGFVPIQDPRRTLDVGCGTGMWAIEYADDNPGTEVLGVDLVPAQPTCVPPNVQFEVDDVEEPWNYSRKFDYIHCQLMIGAINDWPKLLNQTFNGLESGGYLELADIDFTLRCDDNTIPEDAPINKWMKGMLEGAGKANLDLTLITKVPQMMREQGFKDVEAFPIKWPINSWPKDPTHKELGRWVNENFTWGCESMSLAIFTRLLGWSADEVRVFMTQLRKDLRDRRLHGYWNFWVIYGKKV